MEVNLLKNVYLKYIFEFLATNNIGRNVFVSLNYMDLKQLLVK